MSEALDQACGLVGDLVADHASEWDLTGALPDALLRKLGAAGLLCAEVPAAHGGIGATSRDSGEFTAHVGSLCSSLRSIMTSQGMAAWTVRRLGNPAQQSALLPQLTSGSLAAVGFSEPQAGSDLSAMTTEIRSDGDSVVVDGGKKWVTAAAYADLLLIAGRFEGDAAFVVVPKDTPGVRVERIASPLGCRAAGHADLFFDGARLPADNVLGRAGLPLPLIVTTALAYGRISVAWGCVGILRACLDTAVRHAGRRHQSGTALAAHQLVQRHLAELYIAEQAATRACEHASGHWDTGSPDMVVSTVLAKHVSAGHAARAAGTAVQVLASAGSLDGETVARAYRDAKLMEIIEGTNEICELILAQHVLAASRAG
ncbi:acyl-CoA dehydrogenase family protein [Streptomyces sp. NBC_00986]|uniref:acyl-CoA dehydrogenase family protein n=1 Tax=Streptomyces sp. NBC_00986 TaxID=2903702 RepID=UPI00386ACBFD|nr:acyl-CoA/acyl-ACP dehydrogenase [Streptomyces sp. NBC_00986]WSX64539.1 acyl-CoA/acyl-ACP dehydrogenase [Streptomyces sp. NBC_00986]